LKLSKLKGLTWELCQTKGIKSGIWPYKYYINVYILKIVKSFKYFTISTLSYMYIRHKHIQSAMEVVQTLNNVLHIKQKVI